MAVMIDMNKPTRCDRCRFLAYGEWYCIAARQNVFKTDLPLPKWCPLVGIEAEKWRKRN